MAVSLRVVVLLALAAAAFGFFLASTSAAKPINSAAGAPAGLQPQITF